MAAGLTRRSVSSQSFEDTNPSLVGPVWAPTSYGSGPVMIDSITATIRRRRRRRVRSVGNDTDPGLVGPCLGTNHAWVRPCQTPTHARRQGILTNDGSVVCSRLSQYPDTCIFFLSITNGTPTLKATRIRREETCSTTTAAAARNKFLICSFPEQGHAVNRGHIKACDVASRMMQS